jgi:hypothetical protein
LVGYNSYATQQQQHQQVPGYMLQQQEQIQHAPQVIQQQQQQLTPPSAFVPTQQQQQAAALVPKPVSQHPLGCEPPPRDADVDLSDSMDDDFVVVYNTAGLAAQASGSRRSGSNSSSKASSGLVDPKAAAVLAGAAVSRPWPSQLEQPQQQQQQYHQLGHHVGLLPAGRWVAGSTQQQQQQQQQHLLSVPVGLVAEAGSTAADVATGSVNPEQVTWTSEAPSAAAAGALPADIGSLHAAALQPPSAPQRVQLLVQVVRGCACLLASQEAGGADTAPQPGTQQGEQLALMLLALQLVQAMCLPHSAMQHEHEDALRTGATTAEELDADVSLSDMLAAASQADLEQLMGGAVELLRLSKALAGLNSSTAAGDEGCWGGSELGHVGHSQFADTTGDIGRGLGRMTGSLMALPLPDPFAVLYQQALDSCRAAAVEEVMGNWRSSMNGYSLAADLLLFLSYDWPQLGRANPLLLQDDRAALHRLYAAVNARLAAVVAEAPSTVVY